MSEESQVESDEHQDNADICEQPLQESVSEEREIQTDYDGYHQHRIKYRGHPRVDRLNPPKS
jgi:hypothetical protein